MLASLASKLDGVASGARETRTKGWSKRKIKRGRRSNPLTMGWESTSAAPGFRASGAVSNRRTGMHFRDHAVPSSVSVSFDINLKEPSPGP